MKLGGAGLWFGSLTAICVLYLVVFESGRTSPGQLAKPHYREPELRGEQGCVLCHGDGAQSMTQACLDCHDFIDEQVSDGTGLHGSLPEAELNCARCHSEHHGVGFDLINRQSFARAGAPEPGSFDHALVGFPIYGAHAEQECAACHEYAEHEVLPKGEARFVGLDRNCESCHDDFHEGKMVVACALCHSQNAWDERGTFGHEELLNLAGGHEGIECAACHEPQTAHSLSALGRGARVNGHANWRACADCHENPHMGQLIRGAIESLPEEERVSPKRTCEQCHLSEHTSFRDERLVFTDEQHATTGFSLDAPHADATCEQCHESQLRFDRRYPGREADDCAACHEDPHDGQFETGPFAEKGCVGCHARQHFEPHGFDVAKHEKAFLPLDGKHAQVDCYTCHLVPEQGDVVVRTFRGTPNRCENCHDDAHRGFFDERFGDELARVKRGTCSECHATEGFTEVADERFDHGRWTGLDIHGAHSQTACETCHPRSADADDFGRTLGFVSDLVETYNGCESCHLDPHRGGFDADPPGGTKRAPDGTVECSSCHEQSSFRAFPGGWDHGKWTGFKLDGAHLTAGCTACHAPQSPDEHGRTWKEAVGSACSACHETPHAGQFRREGETVADCRRCHVTALGFEHLVFSHNKDSQFPLDQTHTKLDCGACHKPWETTSGLEVVRYRPLGRECIDCHGKHDGQGGRRR